MIEPVIFVQWCAIWVIALSIFVVIVKKKKWEKYGKLVFILFAVPTMLTTFYLAGHTVYKNQLSETKGPVHWHADYDIYVCGEKLDLVDPTGFLNKVGTPLFHEHNDHRIHVEGTVDKVENVNVGAYFNVIGGEITSTSLTYPDENKGTVDVQNGELCNGEPAELGVYVNGQKIDDPASYMYYPHPQVPPGDCIIILFDSNLPESITADQYICPFWESAGWDYENFKEYRQTDINRPAWRNENWQYIDGQGMVKVENQEVNLQ